MAAEQADLYADVEPEVRKQAESILSQLGISASDALNIFYKQIILQRGLPFEVKLPVEKPLNINEMTKEELDAALEEGYADILAGRTEPAEKVFADLEREYGL
jgi:DNA-damage-inducible protein J